MPTRGKGRKATLLLIHQRRNEYKYIATRQLKYVTEGEPAALCTTIFSDHPFGPGIKAISEIIPKAEEFGGRNSDTHVVVTGIGIEAHPHPTEFSYRRNDAFTILSTHRETPTVFNT